MKPTNHLELVKYLEHALEFWMRTHNLTKSQSIAALCQTIINTDRAVEFKRQDTKC